MKKCLFAFLLILLQFGQLVASQDEKRDRLFKSIDDAEQALVIVKSDTLTKYFTVLLQEKIERLEGERIGGDYEAIKQHLVKSQKFNRHNILTDDQLVSFNIRFAIIEYAKKKYGGNEVADFSRKSGKNEK